MKRAYSLLTVKAVSEDERVIRGIATTPTPDRVGDIVEPLGVKFKNPLPLLHQHDSHSPVGTVKFDKPTKDGITFEARLPKIDEPGPLKDRVDTAWGEVKSGLVRAVSIGFRALEYSIMDDGGWRFMESEVLELSLVTIPANSDAQISLVKSIDTELRAASGRKQIDGDATLPGAAGDRKPVNLRPKEGNSMATVQEQIAALTAKRAANVAAMESTMQKSIDEGRSTDAAEQEEFDNLQAEVTQIDADLKRLKALEAVMVQKAADKPVVKNPNEPTPAAPANHTLVLPKKLPPGVRFARMVKCIGIAKGSLDGALSQAQHRYGDDPTLVNVLKAAVAAGSTSDATWAGPLVGDESSVYADFAEFLRPMTILGKFGQGNIPSLRAVPFRTRLLGQSGGGSAGWVGEGKGIKLTKFDFTSTTLVPMKVAAISVISLELLRSSSPSADMLVRDQLVAACREEMDKSFIDPHSGAITDVRPASITSGITALHSTGTDADAVRADLALLIGAFVDANNPLTTGVFVMSATIALKLSLMRNSLGQKEFPDINVNGGTLEGIPVITSEYVTDTTDSGGQYIALVNATDIYYANEGGFEVDMSTEASLEMSDAPANTAVPAAAAQLVSLWQNNAAGFRVLNEVNWARRRTSAVAYIEDVAYAL